MSHYVRRYISGSPLALCGFDLYTAVHETRHPGTNLKTGNRFTFGMYLLITVSVMAKTKLSNFSSSYSNLLPKTIEHMTLAAALLIRPLIHTGLPRSFATMLGFICYCRFHRPLAKSKTS